MGCGIRRGLCGVGLLAVVAVAVPAEDGDERKRSGLVERETKRLVQLDVTVTGPAGEITDLTAEDFNLKIGLRRIREFNVDRVCRADEGESPDLAELPQQTTQDPAFDLERLVPTSFLLYFDQPHLTLHGRAQSMDIARDLIERLVVDGNQATIVSSADRMATLAELTTDQATLIAAIDRLEDDLDQWDPYATREEARLEELFDLIRDDMRGSASRALDRARQFYQEEVWIAEREMRRFSIALSQLSGQRAPKVALYFADNLRVNAGIHYLDMLSTYAKSSIIEEFGGGQNPNSLLFTGIPAAGQAAGGSFDRVIDEAASHNVRLYTIQAEGLVGNASPSIPQTDRVRHTEDTLVGLARETGGRAFLRGIRTQKMVRQLEEDLGCLYILSFDPTTLKEDSPLAVRMTMNRPGVEARVRGRIVVQSESARLQSRLLAAFASPETSRASVPIFASLIPTGYEDRRFDALVQVSIPYSEIGRATWDLGASVVTGGDTIETSGRVVAATAGSRVILQKPVRFRPGPYEIVGVAHNLTTDVITSSQQLGAWPKPNAERAALGPVAVLQPHDGSILFDGAVKESGSVAFGPDEPLAAERQTALVTPLCASRDQKGELRVVRKLIGESDVEFPVHHFKIGDERCVLIRDLIPEQTMGGGRFVYQLEVFAKRSRLTETETTFVVLDGREEGP